MIKQIQSDTTPQFEINKIDFTTMKTLSHNGSEGILFLGCGGDLNEWVNGINDALNEAEVGTGTISEKFEDVFFTETTGGRIDLLLVFKRETTLNIGKLAMWRLVFGDASWLSDYIVNYASQHGFAFDVDDYNEEY